MEVKNFPGIAVYEPENKEKYKIVTRDYDGEKIDVIYRKGHAGLTYQQANELRKGSDVFLDFSVCPEKDTRTYIATDVYPHIKCMQDVGVALRDGTVIYADIYMPADCSTPLPLLIAWGPFGKRPHDGPDGWKLPGVAAGTVSHLSKFEACDPEYWCHHGYAVANVDPRGIGHSEGDAVLWGIEDGRDGYDFIEWAAAQPWCNGRCALFGNSGVAMVQWRIAAEQPPHLACFAAWEATGDMYRESMTMNGIPRPGFDEMVINACAAPNFIEDNPHMLGCHPYYDTFWKSKTPKWSNITQPVYVCAGMCHFHLRGSIDGWRRIFSPMKWLRIHREMEWPDTYDNANMEDLRKFYDRYLKDIRNGWEGTPRVRVDVMDAYDYDYSVKRRENEFPIARTQYRRLYMDAASSSMCYEPYAVESEVEYDSATGGCSFGIKFKEETEITGYMKLHLYLECRGHYNMDLFPWVKKYTAEGEYVPILCMGAPYRGAWGYACGMRRELDRELSTDFAPVQAHQRDEPMEAGKIYGMDIEILPTSRMWHKGEELRVEITGSFVKTGWYEDGHQDFVTDNGSGKTVIHTGGRYASYLQIPFIPPKWTAGDYVYRG